MQTMARSKKDLLKMLPSIDVLLNIEQNNPLWSDVTRLHLLEILRQAVNLVRQEILEGVCRLIDEKAIVERVQDKAYSLLAMQTENSMRRVINATGVFLHTNLGRAPFSKKVAAVLQEVCQGYANLEIDLTNGERGERYSHISSLFCKLLFTEDALVVNNNAGAVLLALTALTKDKEVIVSRGELVEIGGSFRIPAVMALSGAKLIEVGTTNKTNLMDYKNAINENTAAILKVHTSNYKIIGFTEEVDDAALADLAHEHRLILLKDEGSGNVLPLEINGERCSMVQDAIKDGCDLVTFSGDKLFGATQAGIIAGKKSLIDKIKAHQLLRALRIDKLSLAVLETTLREYLYGKPEQNILVQYLLRQSKAELKERAENLACQMKALSQAKNQVLSLNIIETEAFIGGGSLPTVKVRSFAVSAKWLGRSSEKIKLKLRLLKTPIIVRLQNDCLLFDVATLLLDDLSIIIEGLEAVL